MALIAALAVYRLTYMFHSEAGPADIFGRFRTWVGVRYDEYSKPYGKNWIAESVLCFYCLSVWIGLLVTLLMVVAGAAGRMGVGIVILLPFALSGVATFLKRWAG